MTLSAQRGQNTLELENNNVSEVPLVDTFQEILEGKHHTIDIAESRMLERNC